jgi:uncharacterized membrane protein YcaP (DUF421 family)
MKREDLVAMGISEENIEKIIADYGKVTQKANADIAALREKAGKADDLQKKLDDLEAGQLTEIEKANKALEEANKTIADMQKSNAIRDQREAAMTNFKITAEQAKTIVKDDGSLDYAELGKIMSEKETAAAQAKEQEIAKHQDIPGGGAGGDKGKTEAEKTAEAIGKNLAGTNKAAESIVNSYIGG